VQLRGLEPQTPTLPGRLRGIYGGSPPFVSTGQEVWGRPRTATDDPERGSLATIVAPRGGRLIDALDRGPVRRSLPTAGTGLVWRSAVRLAPAPESPGSCLAVGGPSVTPGAVPLSAHGATSPRKRAHRAPPPPWRHLVGRLRLRGAQVPWDSFTTSRDTVHTCPATSFMSGACGPVRRPSSLPSAGKHIGAARGSRPPG
jgi:hypothetical protein